MRNLENAIAIVVTPPPATGMTKVSAQIARELRNQGGTVYAVSRPSGISEAKWTLRKHAFIFRKLLRLRTGTPVYLVSESGRGLWATMLAAGILRLKKAPLFLHHHTYAHCRRRDGRVAAVDKLILDPGGHILLSEMMATDFVANYGQSREVMVLSNAFAVANQLTQDLGDVPALPSRTMKETAGGRTLVVGFVGRVSQVKGAELLHRVADAVSDTQIEFRIVGPISDQAGQDLSLIHI